MRTAASVLCDRDPDRTCALTLVHDLSVGGVRCVGADLAEVGARQPLMLHLPWYRPLTVEGMVIRALHPRAGQPHFSVCFDARHAQTRALLEHAIAVFDGQADPPGEPAVLVLSSSCDLPRLVRRLLALGCRPIIACTPLDAVTRLQREGDTLVMTIVDSRYRPRELRQLLPALAELYPGVPLALLRRENDAPSELEALAHRVVGGIESLTL